MVPINHRILCFLSKHPGGVSIDKFDSNGMCDEETAQIELHKLIGSKFVLKEGVQSATDGNLVGKNIINYDIYSLSQKGWMYISSLKAKDTNIAIKKLTIALLFIAATQILISMASIVIPYWINNPLI